MRVVARPGRVVGAGLVPSPPWGGGPVRALPPRPCPWPAPGWLCGRPLWSSGLSGAWFRVGPLGGAACGASAVCAGLRRPRSAPLVALWGLSRVLWPGGAWFRAALGRLLAGSAPRRPEGLLPGPPPPLADCARVCNVAPLGTPCAALWVCGSFAPWCPLLRLAGPPLALPWLCGVSLGAAFLPAGGPFFGGVGAPPAAGLARGSCPAALPGSGALPAWGALFLGRVAVQRPGTWLHKAKVASGGRAGDGYFRVFSGWPLTGDNTHGIVMVLRHQQGALTMRKPKYGPLRGSGWFPWLCSGIA